MDNSTPHTPAPEDAANYQYWVRHGGVWGEEYAWRKQFTPMYHFQEMMLSLYMQQCAPGRILEYGCGVGRHLRYLRDLPQLEVYGYDQSPSMVGCMKAWAEEEWLAEHVRLGKPVDVLPYPDGWFDVAFTAEVLVHVRPEDLAPILKELRRVTKWHVLHIEPSPEVELAPLAHDGCWKHDLIEAYRQIGCACELLPAGYRQQTPYRSVVREEERPLPCLPPILLAFFDQAERTLDKGIDWLRKQLEQAEAQVQLKTQEHEQRKQELEQLLREKETQLEQAQHEARAQEAQVMELRKTNQILDNQTKALQRLYLSALRQTEMVNEQQQQFLLQLSDMLKWNARP